MSLLQMSASGAVMILVITVMRALAINRLPKKTFLALWGAVLVRLLVPFSLPSKMSIYSLLAWETPPVSVNTQAAVLPAVTEARIAPVLPQSVSAPTPVVSPWSIVWVVGMVLCAAVFAVAYWKCYREFQMSFPVKNELSRRWLQAHPLRRRISIRQTGRVSSPLTFGILHPVILMPKKTDWEDETTLQYVLEHEFTHIRRFDAFSKLLLIGAVCVHWFNPLVWAMYVLANRDMELSCDETVIRHFGSGTRASYAGVLIHMEEVRNGFAPLGSHFSRNAVEERITAIMRTRKASVLSLAAAAVLIAGTVTVFATSAQPEQHPSSTVAGIAAATPNEEFLAAGLTYQDGTWFYQGKAVIGIYDENGIFTSNTAEGDVYLSVQRGSDGKITGFESITKQQFRALVDRHMNLTTGFTEEENTILSYVEDGKTYYSFDDGKTFQPLTDAEFEALYPTPEIQWWTYDEYEAWLENEKQVLYSLIGETYTKRDGTEFTWTSEKVEETIALYEEILEDIKKGILYSKSVDGKDDVMVSMNPLDLAIGTASANKELIIQLADGEEYTFGPYETDEEMLAAATLFCEEQVKQGNMTQTEAVGIISQYKDQ